MCEQLVRAIIYTPMYSSFTHCFSLQVADDVQKCKEHQQKLDNNAQKIKEGSRNVVSGMAKAVDRKVTMVLDDVISQLSNLVDSCDVSFDQHNLLLYKEVSVWWC